MKSNSHEKPKKGIQTTLHFTKNLEILKPETERFLEDVPDYDKKLKAWGYCEAYYSLPEEDRGELISATRNHYGTRNEGTARGISAIINAKFGFPITGSNEKNDVVIYKDIKQIEAYCKDILDRNGQLLPSKFQSDEIERAA